MTSAELPMHSKRKELGEVSRQNILDVASRLMAERGYDGTSMSQLCKEVGLPSSSIYWHFGSKEGVLASVMERGASHFFESFPEPDWLTGTPSQRLHQVFLRTGTSLIEDPVHSEFLQLQIRFRLNRDVHQGKGFYDIAESVRQQGVAFMASWIFRAYEDLGQDTARRLGEQLAEFGVALIDGVYLAAKAGSKTPTQTLLNLAATSLVAAADEILGNESA